MTIRVSETFYSIQGEGPTLGYPSIFLRLAGCNLLCGGAKTLDGQLHDGATWRCDTIEVWTKGQRFTDDNLFEQFFLRNGWDACLRTGAHLVITGGEPLRQDSAVRDFLGYLAAQALHPYVEIETNGTIVPSLDLWLLVDQWNVSPKLANSGMPRDRRIKAAALEKFAPCAHAFFKFVVTCEADIEEAIDDYIMPFAIEPDRVFLMPGADNAAHLQELRPMIAELCKMHGYRFSDRLHIAIWDRKTGV